MTKQLMRRNSSSWVNRIAMTFRLYFIFQSKGDAIQVGEAAQPRESLILMAWSLD